MGYFRSKPYNTIMISVLVWLIWTLGYLTKFELSFTKLSFCITVSMLILQEVLCGYLGTYLPRNTVLSWDKI
ncbi:hypothetical protein F4820DRAFT_408761 [Hypoxylon rubiginosum]|uniref:Uncharacterized protein n=1 Tax=Hypoxylon rubiginosum TaxID=110542 RepID=A0ACB9ZBU9_9PEZI|nr:hypothetical protein F4820DRAFT_408761 [Hypoxylon rubiginosum]